jgi:RNA polymerase sigma-70 factor, ECF subfamily
LAESPGPSHPYSRYFPPLRAKCRRLLGATAAAEDVAQEAIVRLWKSKLSEGKEGGDTRTIMAWLYRTCTRLAIDELRQRRRTGPEADLDATPCGVDVAACVEARHAIAALVNEVPADELDVAVLCRVDGLSQPEAALVLGVSDRTVRRQLERFDARAATMRRELTS